VENETEKTEIKKKDDPSTFTKLRYNHKFRLGFIFALMVIVGVMFFFFEKMRIALAVIFIILLSAFGLEATQNDWDLQQLWESKSFEQSKITRDIEGNILYDKMGNVTTDSEIGKEADDYNCADFATQPEAQAFFERIGGIGHDVNRLDGNKDSEACESLPLK